MRVLSSTYALARSAEPLVGLAEQFGRLAVGEVDHQALSPRVAAIVHHGGAGTTTTATRAGAPQVVVPLRAIGMATRFVTPVRTPCCAHWSQATSDRS
jgi:UDP:flavonoid glycosyltransferase YjiC (YdhE family)